MWPAVVSCDARQFPCTLLDISERGARVESLTVELPRSSIKLQCEHFGILEGWVIWTKGKVAGIGFKAAPAEIARFLKPVVPGLDRQDRAAQLPPLKAPRQFFGRRQVASEADAASGGPDPATLPAESTFSGHGQTQVDSSPTKSSGEAAMRRCPSA